MKSKRLFLILSLLIFGFGAHSQNEEIANKVLQVYKDESLPYLRKFSTERYYEKDENLSKASAYAQYEFFVAKTEYIEQIVRDTLKKNQKAAADKSYVSKLTSFQYGEKFPGLPRDFWESVDKKVKNL